jgi:hypothetical protein
MPSYHYKNACNLTRVYSTRYCRHASNLTRVFGDTCQIVWPSKMDTCIEYTRPIGHVYRILVSNWTRVLYTRVQLDTCNNTRVQLDTSIYTRVQLDAYIKYSCPIGRVYYYTRPIVNVLQFDTYLLGHVSNCYFLTKIK